MQPILWSILWPVSDIIVCYTLLWAVYDIHATLRYHTEYLFLVLYMVVNPGTVMKNKLEFRREK